MFRFSHISYFYLLLVIPVFAGILVLFLLWRKRKIDLFGERLLVMQLMQDYSNGKLIFKFILLMIGYSFLVLALAEPQTGSKLEKVQRKGIDLILALDVSNSMLAQDIKPSRLDRAKQDISKLIDRLEGDR